MNTESIQDEAMILEVRNWQTADKYAVCFCRDHGKVPFIAYGAAYPKSVSGRLVQPFAHVRLTLARGRRVATLKSCEFVEMPKAMDVIAMAYGAIISEVAIQLLEDEQPQEGVFELLSSAYKLLLERNKRIVTDSTILKLLTLCGFEPYLDSCTTCGKPAAEDGYFSLVQGGFLCKECAMGDELTFSVSQRDLMDKLLHLDFNEPDHFVVRGGDLMQVEKIIYRFLMYQTDRPLKSLNFLAQLESVKA
jgi:DNA repair protein RecO (recombination protein O)